MMIANNGGGSAVMMIRCRARVCVSILSLSLLLSGESPPSTLSLGAVLMYYYSRVSLSLAAHSKHSYIVLHVN